MFKKIYLKNFSKQQKMKVKKNNLENEKFLKAFNEAFK